MIKEHMDTGLKYLCKTSKQNPLKYKGSGKYWKRHMKVHGTNVSTIILHQCEDIAEFNKVCLEYSEKFDVVKSKNWANCIPENGLDGGKTFDKPTWLEGYKHSDETKAKISKNNARSLAGKPSNFIGRTHSEESKLKMSLATKGRKKSEAHKLALSLAKKGKPLGKRKLND